MPISLFTNPISAFGTPRSPFTLRRSRRSRSPDACKNHGEDDELDRDDEEDDSLEGLLDRAFTVATIDKVVRTLGASSSCRGQKWDKVCQLAELIACRTIHLADIPGCLTRPELERLAAELDEDERGSAAALRSRLTDAMDEIEVTPHEYAS